MALSPTFMQAYAAYVASMSTNQEPVNKSHGAINGLFMLGNSPFGAYPQQLFKEKLEALPYYGASGLKIPTLSASGVTVHASRQPVGFTDPTTGQPTSAFVSPTVVTVEVDFTHIPSDFLNNAAGAAESFSFQMAQAMRKMANAADAAAIVVLDAIRNRVDPADAFMAFAANTLSYTDSTSGGDLQKFLGNTAVAMGQVPAICEKLNQERPVLVVGSPNMGNILKLNNMFGAGNTFDASMFSLGTIPYMSSNNVTPTAGAYAKGYFINPGQVQACAFTGSDARAGLSNADAPVEVYTDPIFGETVEMEARVQRGNFDLSGSRPGATVVYGEKYTFTLNIAFVTTGNATPATNPSGVLAVEVIKS